MRSRRTRARAAALAGLTALPLLVAGCTSDGSGGPEETPGTESPGSPGSPGAEGSAEVVGTVARGLRAPWGIAELPGGDLLVGLRDEGTIQHIAADGGGITEAGAVPGVVASGEGGLLGLALDPGGRHLYAYYTTASDNRVSRFRYEPSAPAGERLADAETLVSGIPRGEVIHNGGGLEFGPDGMLYASTGDTGDGELAQDEKSLAGKILRIDPETGEPPSDNPDPGSLVYSMGHRNVQGLAWDAEGRMWATEFGDDSWDELNLITSGGNYGWPEFEGRGGEDDGFTDPVAQWPPAEASPSGLAYSQGSLWLASLRGERLWRVPLDGAAPAAEPQAFFEGEHGRLRAVLPVGGDELLLVTNETDTRGTPSGGDDRILRLRVS
ncbi:PQQ-dependent sugar dehydrogenase [Streptomyces sp. 6N223]|uniref:PQQ-dependent sugar dehydrogenase n=1 Tax=Streptomyces sp. 6N223 TaxID=3457412 RepID=UPI003FD11F68